MRTTKPTGYKERWQRIEAAMEAAGIESQVELAKLCGVSSPATTKWKTGAAMPQLEHMAILAAASGYCIEWIMLGRGRRRYDADERHQQLVEILDSLDEDTRRDVIAYAKYRSHSESDDTSE